MDEPIDESQLNLADVAYFQGLPRDAAYETAIKWLSGKDPRRRRLAMVGIVKAGKAATDLLLIEALSRRKSPAQRIRLFAAIEQIGCPLDGPQFCSLMIGAQQFPDAVRTQIAHLIDWNRGVAARLCGTTNPFDTSQSSEI